MKFSLKAITTGFITASLLLPYSVFAEDLESPNYKIQDVSINSSGEALESQSGDYNLLTTMGDFSANPRLYSTNYQVRTGPAEVFQASIPIISCFETVTDGSSNCANGPAYLANGVTRLCGPSGCYDRARFEIDAQGNPADTLYAIQISTDNFASDTRYLDGTTYMPKSAASKTISDYKIKADWEAIMLNVRGLTPSTQYYVRAIAAHGDFTESEPSPIVTATTTIPNISLDLDIAGTGGTATETAGPHNISMNIGGSPAPASNLIWIDINSNAQNGIVLSQEGLYGGLYSSTANYTLTSATTDLGTAQHGFGLQSYYASQLYNDGSGNGFLGTIAPTANYSGSSDNVGQINTSLLSTYTASAPVHSGRTALYVKGKGSSVTPSASDYTETITIVLTATY